MYNIKNDRILLFLYNFSSRLASLVRLTVDITRSRTRFKSLREMEEIFEVLVFMLLKKRSSNV